MEIVLQFDIFSHSTISWISFRSVYVYVQEQNPTLFALPQDLHSTSEVQNLFKCLWLFSLPRFWISHKPEKNADTFKEKLTVFILNKIL